MEKTLTVQLSTQGDEPWNIDAPVSAKKPFKHAVFGYLVNISDSLIVEPGLLEDWSWDFEAKKYIFKVRKGLKFHNGRPVLSTDVEFSLQRWYLMQHPSFEKAYVRIVKGIDTLKSGGKFVSGTVSGIKIIDERTLSIEVSSYNPTFLHSLIDVPLVPIEELKDDYFSWKSLPVGAGVYRVEKAEPTKGIYQLVAQVRGVIQKINLLMKNAAGQNIDISTVGGSSIEDPEEITIQTKHDWIGHILFNYDTELGRDKNFRKAIQHGLERRKIASLISKHAQPACEIVPPSFWGSSEYTDFYNLSLAREYLAKVPKRLLSQEMVIPALRKDVGPYLQEIERQINEIGIKTRFVGGWDKFATHDTSPIRLIEINVSSPDPLLQFSFFIDGSPLERNFPRGDATFDKLFAEAANAPSFDVKVQAIVKLSEHMKDQTIAVQTHATPPIFWVNKRSHVSVGKQRSSVSFFLDRVRWQ